MTSPISRRGALVLTSAIGMLAAQLAVAQTPMPASPRVDAIRKAGMLRVGVLANPPWLTENTKNPANPWGGPAWTLAVNSSTSSARMASSESAL